MAGEHQQRGLDLLGPLHDHLKRLADKDLGRERNVGALLRHNLGALQVRLTQLQEAFVDDVVVQLLLLLELEDLRGLVGEHILDVVEHDVVILHVERAAHVQRPAERVGQLERDAHRPVAVRRTVDAHEEAAARERAVVAHEEQVLLDATQHARDHSAQLRVALAAKAVCADSEEVVAPSRRADEPGGGIFLLCDEPAVLADFHVAAHAPPAVVARGAVGVEADEPRQPAGAAVHLIHDFLVVDAFQKLASQADAGRVTPLAELVQKAVGYQLQAFFDQLVVDLALLLDLLGGLKLCGEAGFELPKADVVEAGRVHVVAGDATAGLAAQLDRPVDRPIRMRGVVDGDEDLAVHRHLPLRAGRVCEPLNGLSSKPATENATAGLVGRLAWYQLPTFRVPHCYRIHRARIARPQQPLPLYGLRIQEHRHGLLVQFETLRSLLHAVPEPDALIPVDYHAQPMDPPLIQPLHIPSRPSSLRAVSITVGVISAIPRSFA